MGQVMNPFWATRIHDPTPKYEDNRTLRITLSHSMLSKSVCGDLAMKATSGNHYKDWCGICEAFLPIYRDIQWLEICVHLSIFIICINLREVDS